MGKLLFYLTLGVFKIIIYPLKAIVYIFFIIIPLIIIYFRIKYHANAVNLIDLVLCSTVILSIISCGKGKEK